MNERLIYYRETLHLSQEYVSSFLNISRAEYSQMEQGNRELTEREIDMLCTLFGISPDLLISGEQEFAQNSEDEAEILSIIRLKERTLANNNAEICGEGTEITEKTP